MKAKYSGHIDWVIMLLVSALLLFSIPFVYSASAAFADAKLGSSEKLLWNQALRVVLGICAVIFFSRIDYHRWQKYSRPILIVALMFLVVVLFTSKVKGASRWIYLGAFSFQPSELAKFALVMHVSTMLVALRRYLDNVQKGIMPIMAWVLATCMLISLQPNFSTSLVLFLISLVLLFIGESKLRHLLWIGGTMLSLAALYAVSAEYRLRRILDFLQLMDSNDVVQENYQLDQALLAFGNGGLFGVGPGQSRQRDFFLPESYGDFIFSIVGEEYGYVGVVFVLLCFLVILWRGLKIARNAPDEYGRYLAIGITITITMYALVNAGVNTGLLPTTGLPMPFSSYGGTSIFFSCAAVGILLNVAAQSGLYPRKTPLARVPMTT